jgi:hypothetical protein
MSDRVRGLGSPFSVEECVGAGNFLSFRDGEWDVPEAIRLYETPFMRDRDNDFFINAICFLEI